MKKLETRVISKIIELRLKGKSIPEISAELGIGKTTVQRYVLDIKVPEEHLSRLKEKQGGSKDRANALRANTFTTAQAYLQELSPRDYLVLIIGLYWGEGTKRDFGIINSDPKLIQTFIVCLSHLGIQKERLSISLRVHSDISISRAKEFWSTVTGLPIELIRRVEIVEGKKKGKLAYGMCRIRIRSGIKERLFIQSLISLVGKDSNNKLVSS